MAANDDLFFTATDPRHVRELLHVITPSSFRGENLFTDVSTNDLSKAALAPHFINQGTQVNVVYNESFTNGVVDMFNMQGNLVNSFEINSGSFSFSKDNMNSGVFIYLVKENASIVGTGKLVVTD